MCAPPKLRKRTSHKQLFSLCHSDLPWQVSRTPLRRKLLGLIEIALLSKVLMPTVPCAAWSSRQWLLYHWSVVWFCEWEIQRQLYNLKFQLPQRKRYIWHPGAVSFTIFMEIRWNWEAFLQGRSDENLQERLFIFEIKGLFSKVASFIRSVPQLACYWCLMQV